MKVRPSAVIIKDDCVLTLRYNYQSTNVFALPGGNPDPGEDLTEALKRELQEELGIVVSVGDLMICGDVIWNEIKKETHHTVFKAVIVSGIPELNPSETTALEIKWLPVPSLSSHLLYPNFGNEITSCIQNSQSLGYLGKANQPYIS
tara:strand:+ start:109 stop:549 length:441 start_codon:yes stop_codon:yes gene_type:complete